MMASAVWNPAATDDAPSSAQSQQRNLLIHPYSEYNIHPTDAFELYTVCVDPGAPDCGSNNALSFVGPAVVDPGPNEFRYHNSGPASLQGVHWFQEQIPGSSLLASFAQTRQDFATGVLGSQNNEFAVALRPRGDHNWAFAGDGSTINFGTSAWINEQVDILYKFELTGGTLAAPTNFMISGEGRIISNCVRYSVSTFLYYCASIIAIKTNVCSHLLVYFVTVLAQFTMDLVTDPNDPVVQRYPNSAVWQRRSTYLFGLIRPSFSAFVYKTVQIVDGAGQPLQPAYDDFIAYVRDNYENQLFFYGLKPERVGDFVDCFPSSGLGALFG